jgi:hypothetical protein
MTLVLNFPQMSAQCTASKETLNVGSLQFFCIKIFSPSWYMLDNSFNNWL